MAGDKEVKEAIQTNIPAELEKLLENKSIELTWQSAERGLTLLQLAADSGKDAIVDFLISRKVDINAVGQTGSTPLVYAACKGHEHIVRALLAADADVSIKTSYGHTPLALAKRVYPLNPVITGTIIPLLREKTAEQQKKAAEQKEMSDKQSVSIPPLETIKPHQDNTLSAFIKWTWFYFSPAPSPSDTPQNAQCLTL